MLRLRTLFLGLVMIGLAGPVVGQDTKKEEPKKEEPRKEEPQKTDPTLGLGKDLIKEIDDFTVEELLAKVTRAQNMLSRDGQKLLKYRVRLEDAQKTADRVVKSLDSDREVGRLQDLFKEDAFKKDLLSIATITDKAEQAKKLQELLAGNGINNTGSLLKYANFKDATNLLASCKEGVDLINAEFNRPAITPIGGPADGTIELADVRSIVDALKGRPPVPMGTMRETDLAEIIKRLAQ